MQYGGDVITISIEFVGMLEISFAQLPLNKLAALFLRPAIAKLRLALAFNEINLALRLISLHR